jgi:deoxyribodipyrimidine photo-lyase
VTQDNNKRIRLDNQVDYKSGFVVYSPVRDLRVQDNPALSFAQEYALARNAKLRVVFILYPEYVGAGERQYEFMFEGLREFENDLRRHNIPLEVRFGNDEDVLDTLVEEGAGALVTDYSPLRRNMSWKSAFAEKIRVPFFDVDAHNVIPPWIVSDKQEFAAYTIRPKLYKQVSGWLVETSIKKHVVNGTLSEEVSWGEIQKKFTYNKKPHKVSFVGGERAAESTLVDFLENRLRNYSAFRNDPNQHVQSDLSPYLTFGFISRRQVINSLLKYTNTSDIRDIFEKEKNAAKSGTNEAAFLEELLVRAELAENFCYYCPDYDNPKCFPNWAKQTHEKHKKDTREFIYTLQEFENAVTHDPLWNAAQTEMLQTGKMHGYMRMYWAKKVFEWSKDVSSAMEVLVYLNDVYSLDGRDPNGYAGIAWSIGGVHDRAWFERPLFGQIRYMNYNGCKSKFDVKKYEATWSKTKETSLF